VSFLLTCLLSLADLVVWPLTRIHSVHMPHACLQARESARQLLCPVPCIACSAQHCHTSRRLRQAASCYRLLAGPPLYPVCPPSFLQSQPALIGAYGPPSSSLDALSPFLSLSLPSIAASLQGIPHTASPAVELACAAPSTA
jgi:hypothetical protein